MSNKYISDELAIKIAKNGALYFPANKHYAEMGPNATVVCDYCFAQQLISCVGLTDYGTKVDLCLDCYKYITNKLSNSKFVNQQTQQHIVSPPIQQNLVSAQPFVTQPVVAQPFVTQPIVAQPFVTHPVVTQPFVFPQPPVINKPDLQPSKIEWGGKSDHIFKFEDISIKPFTFGK